MKVNDMKLFMYFKLIVKVEQNQPICSRQTNKSRIEFLFRRGYGEVFQDIYFMLCKISFLEFDLISNNSSVPSGNLFLSFS